MLLGAGEEADDGLADGGRRRAVLVGVHIGGDDLGQQVGREVVRRADTARRRGGELQVVDALT